MRPSPTRRYFFHQRPISVPATDVIMRKSDRQRAGGLTAPGPISTPARGSASRGLRDVWTRKLSVVGFSHGTGWEADDRQGNGLAAATRRVFFRIGLPSHSRISRGSFCTGLSGQKRPIFSNLFFGAKFLNFASASGPGPMSWSERQQLELPRSPQACAASSASLPGLFNALNCSST